MAEMIKVRLIDGPTTCIGFSSNMSASRVLRHLGNLGRGVLRRSDGTDVEASAEPLPLGSYTYTFSPAVAPGGPFHQHDHPSQVLICGPVGEPITRIPLAVIKKYPDIQFEDEGDGYGLKHRTFASYKGIMPIVAAYLTSPSPLVAKIQLKGLSLEDAKTLELYARIYDITPLHEDVQDMLGQRTRRRRTQTAQEQQRLQPTRRPLHVIAEPPAVSPIYSKPALYEEAFSYRNIPAEVTFLLKAYADNTSQQEPQSVLELCCGPAAHSIELARRFQARVFAVDSAPPMVQHARMRAQQADVAVDINEGDVRNLHVTPCLESPVDLALCLLGSFSHMLTNADAVHALRSVGRHMRPGGLLVLELAHPGDLFDGSLIVRDGGAEGWEVARPGGGKLMVQWGSDYDNFNPATQILERTVTIDVVEDEDVVEAVEEVQASRQYTLQELDLLAQMTGYEVVQVNGDMTDGVDLDHEDAYRLVICLQKL